MGAALQPVDLGPGLSAVAVAAGAIHSCALLQPGGLVKCWGANYGGQLGIGNNMTRGNKPGQMGSSLPPVDLGPGLTAAAIAAGPENTCAILQPGGLVKCWGPNGIGQLGQGDNVTRGDKPGIMGAALKPVDLGPGLSATQLSTGAYHTCAVLQPGGLLKCFGDSLYGQLGLGMNGTRGNETGQMGSALPPVDLGPGLSASAVAAGDVFTCALLQPGGLVKCWGENDRGQLGQGDDVQRGDEPGEMGAALQPVDLGPGLSATSVAAGFHHACAILQPGGLVKCWGHALFGQLGLPCSGEDMCWARGDQPGEMGAALPPVDLGSVAGPA